MRKTIDILGVNVDAVTMPMALTRIVELAEDGQSHAIVTPNPEFVMQAQTDADFRNVINQADLALPDGVGILWAAKYLSLPLPKNKILAYIKAHIDWVYTGLRIIWQPKYIDSIIPERITGADMVWEISKMAEERGWSIFLLGAADGVAKETAKNLQWLYPNLKIAGVSAGPPYESEELVIQQIKTSQPKFVFLAFSAKEQIRWIKTYKEYLQGVIFIGVGGALDFIAGGVALNAPGNNQQPAKRSPEWLQNHGLEWIWRLFTQPWRITRIKTAVFGFSLMIVKYKLKHTRLA
ncbi:WecB/TagA/CpsF family glycosyltransferase [Patescibacteria group bacterium]|nr:WecB/TagA/CpsF family glycosyltransferase [Patescibacteria group bacterium]